MVHMELFTVERALLVPEMGESHEDQGYCAGCEPFIGLLDARYRSHRRPGPDAISFSESFHESGSSEVKPIETGMGSLQSDARTTL